MKKVILKKFVSSVVSQNRLKTILGGYQQKDEDLAFCKVDCPGGTFVSCTGTSCDSGTDNGGWVKCGTDAKISCPVM